MDRSSALDPAYLKIGKVSGAGAAFKRMLQDDPRLAAEVERKNRAWKASAAALTNSPECKSLIAALDASEQSSLSELTKAIKEFRSIWQRGIDDERSELTKRHIDFDPSSLDHDSLVHLARIVEIPEAEIDGLTYGDIFNRALAYADRIKMKRKLEEDALAELSMKRENAAATVVYPDGPDIEDNRFYFKGIFVPLEPKVCEYVSILWSKLNRTCHADKLISDLYENDNGNSDKLKALSRLTGKANTAFEKKGWPITISGGKKFHKLSITVP